MKQNKVDEVHLVYKNGGQITFFQQKSLHSNWIEKVSADYL